MGQRDHHPQDAGLLRRAIARLIDATLVLALVVFATVSLFPGNTRTEHVIDALRIGGQFDLSRVVMHVVAALLAVGYHTWYEARRGRTVGKAVMGVKVVRSDGLPPTFRVAFARNAWMLFPVLPWVGTLATGLCAFLIAATIFRSRTNTGWHDELVDTTVVRTPSP